MDVEERALGSLSRNPTVREGAKNRGGNPTVREWCKGSTAETRLSGRVQRIEAETRPQGGCERISPIEGVSRSRRQVIAQTQSDVNLFGGNSDCLIEVLFSNHSSIYQFIDS